jgi:phosphohistidine phosphatase SixA
MILTICRHGEAGRAASDQQRELTDRGRDDVAFACHCFHDTCNERGIPHPTRILHSSWVRTTQTADILASAFTHAQMQPLGALVPGMGVAHVDRALEDLGAEPGEHLLLVSHQPLGSWLVDHYLGERGRVPSLSPGGLVSLELDFVEAGCAQLLFWALPPEYEAHV